MNFQLTVEQVMLRDTLNRLMTDRYSFHALRTRRRGGAGWSRAIWASLAEQGYLGVSFAEEDGGLGGGTVEMMLIAETLGAHLFAEPYLASVVLSGTAVRFCRDAALRRVLLRDIVSGEVTFSFCAQESDAHQRRTIGEQRGGTWRLTGSKVNVLHGGTADRLLVAADTTSGTGVFLIDATASGVACRGYATFDGLYSADITFDESPATHVLALGEEADILIERVVQHGIAYIAAEAVGLMRMLLDLTVEHLKARHQFGQPLAQFQALQHRAVDMLIAIEQGESAKIYAAMMSGEMDPVERRKAFAAIKLVIGGAGRCVGQTAVQLHGGIGVTDEHRVGWGMKRLTMIDMLFGDSDYQVAALAELGGLFAAAE